MINSSSKYHRPARGFSLIEVLVSLFVLSVGILGMAALQLQSVKFSQESQWRSEATLLGFDIIERMRANRLNAPSYQYVAGSPAPTDATSISAIDVADWLANVKKLPGGDGTIKWDGEHYIATVTITVNDQGKILLSNNSNATADPTVFTFVSQLGARP